MNNSTFDAVFTFFTALKTDARTLNLVRTLAKNNYKIAVIAEGDSEDILKFCNDNITLFPVKKSIFNKFWVKWIYFFFRSYRIISKLKTNYVFSMDLYTLPFAKRLADKNKAKLIYDSREIYSALGPLAKNNLKQKLLIELEKKFVKSVSSIIVSGEMDKDHLIKNLKSDVDYHLIMNLPFYRERIESNYLREKFSVSGDKIVLLYQGMLLPGRGIIPIMKSMKYSVNSVLILYGEGYYKEFISQKAEELGIKDRIFFGGAVDYDKLHEITCSADIGLAFIEPISLSYKLALPNKMFEYCTAGLPCLASNLPAMEKIIDQYKIGLCLDSSSSPEEIAKAFEELYNRRNEFRKNCLSASKILNYENQQEAVLKLMENNK